MHRSPLVLLLALPLALAGCRPSDDDDDSTPVSDDSLRWTNAAGVSWGLEVRDGGLWTEDDCPYGVSELDVEGADGAVEALWFGGERYGRTP